jgi:NADH-ubiquinone oxidoreductase chain 4
LGGVSVFFDFSFLLVFICFFCLWFFLRGLGFYFSGYVFLDSLSFSLVFLSVFICFLAVYGSLYEYGVSNLFGGFVLCLVSIFFLLFLGFSFPNLFVFYVSFEFIFLVMFVFLMGWGYRPERRQASFYMVFYTLVVSFPFLVFLLWVGYFYGSFLFFVYES